MKHAYFNNQYYGTSSEDDIQKRLARAKVELGNAASQSDDIIIVNNDMQKTFDELQESLLTLFIY